MKLTLRNALSVPFAAFVFLILFSVKTARADIECNLPYYDGMGGDFKLKDHNNKPVSLASLKGKIVWLYFGYTSCPDACPTAMATFRRTLKYFTVEKDKIRVLFITIDPERDTAANLKKYMNFFGKEFTAARGDEQTTRAVATSYGVSYFVTDPGSAAGKIFNHTDKLFLLDNDGKIRGIYDQKDADKLAADTSLIYTTVWGY